MKLTNNNYFSTEAQRFYMSVSQYKAFKRCQAAALAEINGEYTPEKTTALIVGSYVDSCFEGTLESFKNSHPEIFKRDGNLKSDFVKAAEIIERIKRDKLFVEYMSGEKQVIMIGTIEGIPVKIKVDSLHADKIVDLKVMKDFAPIYKAEQGRLSFIEAWGYDIQGAVYQEIVRQNTGKRLPFYIAAATKEKTTDIGIFEVTQPYLDVALEEFRENLPYFEAVKRGVVEAERCEECDFCKETKELTSAVTLEELNLL